MSNDWLQASYNLAHETAFMNCLAFPQILQKIASVNATAYYVIYSITFLVTDSINESLFTSVFYNRKSINILLYVIVMSQFLRI
jgi:hypothetical protein